MLGGGAALTCPLKGAGAVSAMARRSRLSVQFRSARRTPAPPLLPRGLELMQVRVTLPISPLVHSRTARIASFGGRCASRSRRRRVIAKRRGALGRLWSQHLGLWGFRSGTAAAGPLIGSTKRWEAVAAFAVVTPSCANLAECYLACAYLLGLPGIWIPNLLPPCLEYNAPYRACRNSSR
jgi:hypothetical protein